MIEPTPELFTHQAAAASAPHPLPVEAGFPEPSPADIDSTDIGPAAIGSPHTRADINRANAASSTGPVTPEGKRTSSQNSFKHGLTGLTFILLPAEDAQVFADLTADLMSEYEPQSPVECHLVERLAQQQWLSQRAMNFQASAYNEDGSTNDRRLSLALRYIHLHHRLFHQCLTELKRTQHERKCQRIHALMVPPSPTGFVSQSSLDAPPPAPSPALINPLPDPYYPLRTKKGMPPKTKRRR